jgi:Fe-S-cluster containining protein
MTRKTPEVPALPVFAKADHWFTRARAALLDALPCQRGCCRCCIGVFPITRLDAEQMQAGLTTFPRQTRLDIQHRASDQVKWLEAAFPELQRSGDVSDWAAKDLDEVAERFGDLPCPALAPDGSCQVYAFRPMTCRTMGIPVEEHGFVHGACEVQTAVPLIKLSSRLRKEEDDLADMEAAALGSSDEEVFLPYGFIPSHLSIS